MRVVTAGEVRRLLPMAECIPLMRETLRTLSAGDAVQPLRSATWLPDRSGLLGVMPAYLARPAALGVKVVSVFPDNHAGGLDSHQGTVLIFDPADGRLLAAVDGGEITAIRTAAVSAVATDLLARRDARSLALIGSGVQARVHLQAIGHVREIDDVRVWSRNAGHARAFADAHGARAASAVAEAVEGADIVCTVTAAREPVLEGAWLSPGTHVNAVGACIRSWRELDSDAVRRSRLYVDWRESTIHEAGDYLIPFEEGVIDEGHIVGEIGAVLAGDVAGRTSDDEVTLFKSLGVAVEDLAAAGHVMEKAGAGTAVTDSAG